jgi:hypothetical protein
MHAQFRAGSHRPLTTKALTYNVAMRTDPAPVNDVKRPLNMDDDTTPGTPGMLEVVPSSELASPLAPIRSVSFRSQGRDHGDTTPTEPGRPVR